MTAWVVYDKVRGDVWNKLHDWDTDDMRIVFSSVAPGAVTQDVRFAAGGDIDISTGELTGGNVAAGGLALDSEAIGTSDPTLINCADEVIAQHASNPSVRYMYIVNTTNAAKEVIASNDLGSLQDLSLGQTTIDFSNGVISIDGN